MLFFEKILFVRLNSNYAPVLFNHFRVSQLSFEWCFSRCLRTHAIIFFLWKEKNAPVQTIIYNESKFVCCWPISMEFIEYHSQNGWKILITLLILQMDFLKSGVLNSTCWMSLSTFSKQNMNIFDGIITYLTRHNGKTIRSTTKINI